MKRIIKVQGIIPVAGTVSLYERHSLVLEGGYIEDIVPEEAITEQYLGIPCDEWPGAYALPGFIDAHVHLAFSGGEAPLDDFIREKEYPEHLWTRMQHNCRAALHAGITTVRDCGAAGSEIYALRRKQRDGTIQGAEIVACGRPFTSIGGHCWFLNGEVAGEKAIRKAARSALLNEGADFLKIMVSGGNMTPSSNPCREQFSLAEVRAVVEEANRAGALCAAHVHSTESIRIAVTAGVNTLEHASFRDAKTVYAYAPELAESMAAYGILICPTFGGFFRKTEKDIPLGEANRHAAFVEQRMSIIRDMLRRGVPMAFGTDAGIASTYIGDYPLALVTAKRLLGLSSMELLAAATRNAAHACGLGAQIGTLEPGKRADITLLRENPLAMDSAYAHVLGVYQHGELVHDALQGEEENRYEAFHF